MTSRCVRFGAFQFDPVSRQLTRHGADGGAEPIAVGSRALDILAVLLGRPGELVSKDEIMRVVWPGAAVEENNLTVQISSLRRILDAGVKGPSAIQTVPGRGYRFLQAVEAGAVEPGAGEVSAPIPPDPIASPRARPDRPWGKLAALYICATVLTVLGWWASSTGWTFTAPPPTLSVAVLPFTVLDATPEGQQAAALLAEDVVAALGQIEGAIVAARSATQGLDSTRTTPAAVSRAFNVRYLIVGTLSQRTGRDTLNLELEDATSSTRIWTAEFTVSCNGTGPAACLDQAAAGQISTALLDAEARRIDALPQASLSAAELMASIDASYRHTVGLDISARDVARLERLLELEPNSAPVMVKLALELLRPKLQFGVSAGASERLARAQDLAAHARAIAPSSRDLLILQAQILRAQDRWEEARAAFSVLREHDPHDNFLANQLAICLRALGRVDEATAVLRDALTANPDFVENWALQVNLASALFQLGRYAEVVPLSLAAMQSAPVVRTLHRLHLAAAYALLGQTDEAADQITLLRQSMPWPSVRTLMRTVIDPPATRWRLADGLAKAGVPDHIDEQIQGNDPPTTGVRLDHPQGPTPNGAPGVETIATGQLRARLNSSQSAPILLTTCRCAISGRGQTVRVPRFQHGSPVDDAERTQLRNWLVSLTDGNHDLPIVVIGANAASWVPRNFALSLAALGWRHVAWYRGGMDAWESTNAGPGSPDR